MAEVIAAATVALLVAIETFRRKWWWFQAHNDPDNAKAAYDGYRMLADHYEELTGDTRYHAHNTADEQRQAWVKHHSEMIWR